MGHVGDRRRAHPQAVGRELRAEHRDAVAHGADRIDMRAVVARGEPARVVEGARRAAVHRGHPPQAAAETGGRREHARRRVDLQRDDGVGAGGRDPDLQPAGSHDQAARPADQGRGRAAGRGGGADTGHARERAAGRIAAERQHRIVVGAGGDQRVAVRRDRESGGPRQPSDRGAAAELAVAQAADAEGELRQRPGRHVARERGQRAGARGDVERRPVLCDRDRGGPVEAGDRSAVGAVRADAARRAGELGEAPAGRVAREHEQRVGRVAGDVDEAAVRRDRDCVGAAQRGASGAARRGRVGDAAGDAGELDERSVGLAGEARHGCRGRRRHVDVQVVGRDDDRRRALEPARGGTAFLRDRGEAPGAEVELLQQAVPGRDAERGDARGRRRGDVEREPIGAERDRAGIIEAARTRAPERQPEPTRIRPHRPAERACPAAKPQWRRPRERTRPRRARACKSGAAYPQGATGSRPSRRPNGGVRPKSFPGPQAPAVPASARS